MQNSAVISEVKCGYCNKIFRKESSLLTHRCETKRRHEEKSERGVQIGFYAYTRFYQTTHSSSRQKSHSDFINSPYYKAFVKFGRHAIGIRAINPEAMVDGYYCKSGHGSIETQLDSCQAYRIKKQKVVVTDISKL